MMEKFARNILHDNSNKFTCNCTIECCEQPLKLPIFARHCPMLTGIVHIINNSLIYIHCNSDNLPPNLKIKKVSCKYKINKSNSRNTLSKNQMSIFLKTQILRIIVNDATNAIILKNIGLRLPS